MRLVCALLSPKPKRVAVGLFNLQDSTCSASKPPAKACALKGYNCVQHTPAAGKTEFVRTY